MHYWSVADIPDNELPSFDSNKNQGYPSFSSRQSITDMLDQISPYPTMINIKPYEYYDLSSDTGYGYPHNLELLNVKNMKVQTIPFPKMMPGFTANINQDYPYVGYSESLVNFKTQSIPYPRMMPGFVPNINQGYPCLAYPFWLDLTTIHSQVRPYPKMISSIEGAVVNEGYPTLRMNSDYFGAGYKSSINEIEIPRSVMYISDYAFYHTNLTHVKINRHCVYFEHSFPTGCHIKPYRDD